MPLDDKMIDAMFDALSSVVNAGGTDDEKVAKVDAYLAANEKAAQNWDTFLNWWIDDEQEDEDDEDDKEIN